MRRRAEIESVIGYIKAEHRTAAITSKVATATASTPCSLPLASTALAREFACPSPGAAIAASRPNTAKLTSIAAAHIFHR
jgi:hypothetical protein